MQNNQVPHEMEPCNVPETTMHVPLPWHRLVQMGTMALVAPLVNRYWFTVANLHLLIKCTSFLARMGRMMTSCLIDIQ